MANVKISNAPPIGLPQAASPNGTETLPMDQTSGGIVTTVKSTFLSLLGPISVNYATKAVTITTTGQAVSVDTAGNLLVGGAASTGDLQVVINNTSNALDGDSARLAISGGGSSFAFFVTGSVTSTPLVTGGPVGAQGVIRGLGAYPLVFGTSNTSRMVISSTGGVVLNKPTGAPENTLVVGAASNANGIIVNGSTTTNQSFGIEIIAGTSSSDRAFTVVNAGLTFNSFIIRGDGSGQLGIAPTSAGLLWNNSGNFTFGTPSSGSSITANMASGSNGCFFTTSSGASISEITVFLPGIDACRIGVSNDDNSAYVACAGALELRVGGSTNLQSQVRVSTTATTIRGACGINGATPQTPVTGWGTPTGQAVIANYSGTLASLLQTSEVVAEIITALKAFGIFGA